MSAPNPRLYIQPEKYGWTIWQAVGTQPTQQKAIKVAKRRASLMGGSVEWEDGANGRQGPVFPSKYGVASMEL